MAYFKAIFPLLLTVLPLCLGDFEPAYLKVCGKEHKHHIDSHQCPKGLWFRKPLEPGCVCVRGVWALSGGFCDEHTAILVGDGNCFHVSFDVHSVKLLGDHKDPFKPRVVHVPKSVDAVYEVEEGKWTPPIQNDETMLVGINPRQVAQRKDKKLCVDLGLEEYAKPVHIFENPRRMEKEWTLDKKKEYNCPTVEPYRFHVGFGEMFINGKVEPRMMVARNCKEECPGETRRVLKGKKRPLPQGRWLTDAPRQKTMEERNEEREEMRAKFTQLPEHYEREVNEQTLRMMHAHISPILLNVSTPHVLTQEYRYFQQMRKVVEKACPQDYVPKSVVTGLMRMFRQLLWETQDEFFQHVQGNDEGLYDRIMERLQECEEKSLEPSILFTTYTDSFKPNATPPMEDPKPERCPVPLIYAVNGTQYNRTYVNDKEENLYIKNITGTFQPHLKFNASQVDFVIETAWKIAMIGHYRCSRYFDDQTAKEFSTFFSQIQSFFNPRIIKRWYYQKSLDPTYDVVRMIFPSYDLKKFMFGLDVCLFGIQGFSLFDYSNIWLQRPKVPMTENDLKQKKWVMPGMGSRVSTKDYAPDVPGKGGNGTGRRRRRKRDADGFYLWNEQARCLDDWMDPVKRKEFDYRLPSGCVTPVE